MKRTWLFILGLFFYSNAANAQDSTSETNKYWLDAGLGYFESTNNIDGFSSQVSLNLIKKSTLYKLRFLFEDELAGFGMSTEENFYNVGLMLGKGVSTDYVQIYFLGGLGITGGVMRGDIIYQESGTPWYDLFDDVVYEEEKFITPSIPIEIDLLFKPSKNLGLGIAMMGDLNFERPTFGVGLKLAVGKLR